ncbi:TauD/TfdA family dioxygenase [Mangrovimicrobium sediminis]|uniref:TauD/TfdA family dioxygenase n=1 Tax=Mangrovimicrobium sediminis TaxID=2562682 RepID=A0A4Z0LX39_9GAMM|nr:TauD/TfdA family dioxygenase [Haliea sp. SAOS-164]TGD71707.1 TauD/TfdA family dioxygenase [Haliea sp. SAOS-164]
MTSDIQPRFRVRDLKPAIGSEVLSDRDTLLGGEYAGQIRELMEQRGVLVFPGIGLDDADQVAFTKTLGTFAYEVQGDEIFKITMDSRENDRADYLKGAFFWHIDGTMSKVPILASILTARVLPSEGGDTEFCNTYAAYDALPESRKAEIEDLRVLHSFWNSQLYHQPEPTLAKLEEWMSLGTQELPLVWKHRSGRKSLVLGNTAQYVIGMDSMGSARLLHGLREWATGEAFFYRHQWSPGDMVIWDNTGTMHRATPYDAASGRMMHRTKLEGEEPFQ